MSRHLTLLFILIIVIAGCKNNSREYALMEKADSLIEKEQEDSALYILSLIDTTAIKHDEEKAYYNLLQTCARYRRCIR